VELHRLRLPLTVPYHLSFGDLDAFETVLAHAFTDAGEGWGEATPLPGYSHESGDEVWEAVVTWSRALQGGALGDALSFLEQRIPASPFACTCLATAIECALAASEPGSRSRSPFPSAPASGEPFALVGTIRSSAPAAILEEVPRLIRDGYTTLKLKIGTNVHADLANVGAAQRALGHHARLRLDANQGYTLDQAAEVVGRADPAGIELFEQPFPPERWDWMETLGAGSRLPLMLDESIEDEDDIDRAARTPGVRYVKFKLMKAGTIGRLRRFVDRATRRGLGVIVGNGVAGEIGCLHEAWAVAGRLRLSGEMNGFLKPVDSLLAEPVRVQNGMLILPSPEDVRVLPDRLARYGIEARGA
jgi:L-alanine-DL-glutamate epimerase-like enolase superfamily enzyme